MVIRLRVYRTYIYGIVGYMLLFIVLFYCFLNWRVPFTGNHLNTRKYSEHVFAVNHKFKHPTDNSVAVRTPIKSFESNHDMKIDWESYEESIKERFRFGPGEQGAAVLLNPEQKSQATKTLNLNGFSIYVSDMISVNRSVKDLRDQKCKGKLYIKQLPSVSVVIPVFEEHWKTLLRTVYSIINRAPKNLIKEIILVDDGSSRDYLKGELDDYFKNNFPTGFVKVVHLKKRQGLICARLEGAKIATADVLLFIDSHCETGTNWLPPLLEPIATDYKTVTCPLIDIIEADTFEYLPQDDGARGVFDWDLTYQRIPRLPSDKSSPEQPFSSPVMAGGLFAISRKWFWELGGYDPGLQIWGGEQFELSFKIWMCGGKLLDIPCSRIGHIYRGHRTSFPEPNLGNFLGRNYRRVAEVWMDEYKQYVYMRHPDYRTIHPGDLSAQFETRKRLQCKTFKWYLEEIIPDLNKMYPVIDPLPSATGKIRSLVKPTVCIDARDSGKSNPVKLGQCVIHETDSNGLQNFELTFHDDVRVANTKNCLDVPQSGPCASIVLFPCHGQHGNQHFEIRYVNKSKDNPIRLRHVNTNLCIDFDVQNIILCMNPCDEFSQTQQWQWDTLQIDKADESKRKAGLL